MRLRNDAALYRCYEVLAQGWRDQGQYRLAIAIAERAIALDPDNGRAYYHLGIVYDKKGARKEARDAYRRSEELLAEA